MRKHAVVFLLLLACRAWSTDPAITVNAGLKVSDIDPRVLGYNQTYFNGANWLWQEGPPRQVKTQAGDTILFAGIGEGAPVRFPGGGHGDECRARGRDGETLFFGIHS